MPRAIGHVASAMLLVTALAVGPTTATAAATTGPVEPEVPHVLLFSGTYGFRHGSIEHAVDVITDLSASTGTFTVSATEDPAAFTEEALAATDIVLFANTTGETPFSDAQRAMIERWLRDGGGFMGIHAAADTNYEWPFYQQLVGAAFESHPHTGMAAVVAGIDQVDEATVQVESRSHPVNAGTTADAFPLREEYYRWREDPRGTADVQVLLSLDETTTYGTGFPPTTPSAGPAYSAYPDDQPLEWVKTAAGPGTGRVWYSNLGHYDATYDRDDWQDRFVRAVDWVHAGTHLPPPATPSEPARSGVDGTFIALPAGVTTGFATRVVVLPQGSTGTLVNLDLQQHNVLSVDKDANRRPLFTSPAADQAGGSAPITGIERLEPGDYGFFCSIHPEMEGTLTIAG